jgi:hypothetical protein
VASCKCATFDDLEFLRTVISKRIKVTKALIAPFEHLAKDATEEHSLLRCGNCGQFWQVSRAWNWGNNEYAFRVPDTSVDDWLERQYVQPDELMLYASALSNLPAPEATVIPCRELGCSELAIKFSVFCRRHHLNQLRSMGQFPAYPSGKWFSPYVAFRT